MVNKSSSHCDTSSVKEEADCAGDKENHGKQENEAEVFGCDKCPMTFLEPCTLKNHILSSHGCVKFSESAVCLKSSTQSHNLKLPMRSHSWPHESSTACKKTFEQSGSLKRHNHVYTGERPHKCSVCRKTFTRLYNLEKHMCLHTGKKAHECSVCKKTFTHSRLLMRHIHMHTREKPYECSVCKKTFTRSGHLKIHMLIHTGEKPYECSVCKKTFAQVGYLKRHIHKHTGE